MNISAYIIRCIVMFSVTWVAIRLIGKKSIINMTSYDLSAIILLTTVAAEPLELSDPTKAAVGIAIITIVIMLIGYISLSEKFYNLNATPIVVVANGRIFEEKLKKVRMNIPMLLSELRIQGYQDLSGVAYAILEPNGKVSVIPTSDRRPVQPLDMAMTMGPVKLSFPIIIDGRLKEENLLFTKKDKKWLMDQLNICGVSRIEDVLIAQMDSSGNIYIDLKRKDINLPHVL